MESGAKPEIKGPDDDEEFLWNIEKNHFKARREQERAARAEEERIRRAQERYNGTPGTKPGDSVHESEQGNSPDNSSSEDDPSSGTTN